MKKSSRTVAILCAAVVSMALPISSAQAVTGGRVHGDNLGRLFTGPYAVIMPPFETSKQGLFCLVERNQRQGTGYHA